MKCPHCGAYNEDDSLFCANCGRPLTGPEAKKAAKKATGSASGASNSSAAGGHGATAPGGGVGSPFRGNGSNNQSGQNNTWSNQVGNQSNKWTSHGNTHNNSWNSQNTTARSGTQNGGSRQGGSAGQASGGGAGGPASPVGSGSGAAKAGGNRAPVLVAAVVALVVVLGVVALASGGRSSSGTTGGSGATKTDATLDISTTMVDVPDVTGYSLSIATSLLQDADLAVGTVSHQSSDSVSEGSVISQDPVSGPVFSRNSTVDLVVSDGPQSKVHSYTLVQQAMTWEQAKAYCESQGGYLATITSSDEYAQVLSVLSGTETRVCWVGGYAEGGTWKWVTGEDFSYNAWASGEPNNDGGNENYLALLCANDTWGWYDVPNDVSDVYRSYRMGFVMETES